MSGGTVAEKQRLALFWKRFKDGVDFALEAHGQHFIRLVQDEESQVTGVQRSPPEMVKHPPWGANDNLRALRDLIDLPLHRGPPVNRDNANVLALAEPFQLVGNLVR